MHSKLVNKNTLSHVSKITTINNSYIPKAISLVFISAFTLLSCGGGDDKGVPPRNSNVPLATDTVVSGVVMIGPVSNADVIVYQISVDKSVTPSKIVRTPLASSTQQTTSDGKYSVTIKPADELSAILVCATGGRYDEPASAALAVAVTKDFATADITTNAKADELCAITTIKLKQKRIVNLTYFTHLAFGLASNKLITGESLFDIVRIDQNDNTSIILSGISSANKIVSNWLQMDISTAIEADSPLAEGVVGTTPTDITKYSVAVDGDTSLTDEVKYGLANAAISDLVDWMRLSSPATTNSPHFSGVSTIGLAQLIFKDIVTDGELEGSDAGANLKISETTLTGSMLRHNFAFKLFVVTANNAINGTNLTNADVNAFITAVNTNASFFTSTAFEPIDNTVASFLAGYPTTDGILEGEVKITVDVTDVNDISSIAMTIETVPPGGNVELPVNVVASNPAKPEWKITTVSQVTATATGVPDGIYQIKFVAQNSKGTNTTFLLSNIRISNTGIQSIIVSPPIVPATDLIKNPTNSLAGFEVVVNDIFFQDSAANSKVSFSIESTDAASPFQPLPIPLRITATEPNGYSEISAISRKYFASDLSATNTVPDGKYKLVVNADSGKNVIPLLTALPTDVEFEYDTAIPVTAFGIPNFKVFSLANVDAIIDLQFTDPLKDGYSSTIKAKSFTHDSSLGERPVDIINNQVTFKFSNQGWHQLTINTMDYAGNSAITNSLQVSYDITPPVVQIINSADVTMKWQSQLDISVKVDDAESGISEIFTGLNISANTGNNQFTGDITTAPIVTNTMSFTDQDLQANVPDGIHKYSVRASDFTGLVSNTITNDVLKIGIDTTPPVITFVKENITGTLFSAAPVWKDVSTLPAVTFDPTNTSATMNWTFDAIVEEAGYIDHTLPTTIAGLSSGLATVSVDGASLLVVKANAPKLLISESKTVVVSNLPQYTIESTAAVIEEWRITATCQPIAGGTMSINGNDECEETTGNRTRVRNTVYEWIQIRTNIDLNAALPADIYIADAAVLSANADSAIVISSMDKSSVPNAPGLSGNESKTFACLNFRVSNTTTLTVPRTLAEIVADSGVSALLPIEETNLLDPTASPTACEEANINSNLVPWEGTPLIPVLDPTDPKAAENQNFVLCTIKASSTGTTTPAATTSTYQVEMQLSPATIVDPADTNFVCP